MEEFANNCRPGLGFGSDIKTRQHGLAVDNNILKTTSLRGMRGFYKVQPKGIGLRCWRGGERNAIRKCADPSRLVDRHYTGIYGTDGIKSRRLYLFAAFEKRIAHKRTGVRITAAAYAYRCLERLCLNWAFDSCQREWHVFRLQFACQRPRGHGKAQLASAHDVGMRNPKMLVLDAVKMHPVDIDSIRRVARRRNLQQFAITHFETDIWK